MRAKLLFPVILFLFSFSVNAQKDSSTYEFKTLLGDNITHGGYGAFSIGYTKLGSYNSFTPGMKGAWIINHSIGVGFAGYGFMTGQLNSILPDENYSFITGGYGGFLIEPVFFSNRSVHFTVPIIIGGGAVTYISERHLDNPNYYPTIFDDFFVFEPGVELELNMVSFFRIAFGVSYRITSDINLSTDIAGHTIQILDKKDLNQLVVSLNFKFGKF